MSGAFGASNFFFGDTGFYPYEINSSVRLNNDQSSFLSRTMTSTGNRKVFTFSCWIKRNQLEDASLFSAGTSATDRTEILIVDNGLMCQNEVSDDRRIQKTFSMMLVFCCTTYHPQQLITVK